MLLLLINVPQNRTIAYTTSAVPVSNPPASHGQTPLPQPPPDMVSTPYGIEQSAERQSAPKALANARTPTEVIAPFRRSERVPTPKRNPSYLYLAVESIPESRLVGGMPEIIRMCRRTCGRRHPSSHGAHYRRSDQDEVQATRTLTSQPSRSVQI